MIKLLLLAVVPFMTEHRNVAPKTEVSTNFYGSVTGIVDNAYIQAHGGGGVNTNDVLDIVRDEIIPATNKLDQTLSDAIDAHVANKNNPHAVTAAQVGAWNLNGVNETKAKSQSILIKSDSGETLGSISVGITASGLRLYVSDTGISGGVDASSIAIWPSRISVINGDETVNIRWADIITQKIVQQVFYQNGANAELPVSSAAIQDFWKVVASPEIYTAISGKQNILNPGDDIHVNSVETDSSSSFGNIIIKENNGLAFRGVELSPHGPLERISVFRGKTAFEQVNDLIGSSVSETNPAFSNAVLAVGLNIDTNSVAVLNDIAATFGGFPIEGTVTTVGGLLAALAAAVAWLKKNKVGSFESVGGATATVENGVAKLEEFFKNSNSLLTGTIDAEVISKGTAPDAHLEAPTDERLKLILADSSVAYDSAKALPYKLASVIGDRVVATMTLTAASTDITLPTISANDTTVKDFILDVTNAYAVEGVATDAGINIPRTDFKLVTRDGESLTAVTTVKAGKSAFICFTQKSPVVVDGTTYPCWCVIQLPFGDPS